MVGVVGENRHRDAVRKRVTRPTARVFVLADDTLAPHNIVRVKREALGKFRKHFPIVLQQPNILEGRERLLVQACPR